MAASPAATPLPSASAPVAISEAASAAAVGGCGARLRGCPSPGELLALPDASIGAVVQPPSEGACSSATPDGARALRLWVLAQSAATAARALVAFHEAVMHEGSRGEGPGVGPKAGFFQSSQGLSQLLRFREASRTSGELVSTSTYFLWLEHCNCIRWDGSNVQKRYVLH